MQCAKTYLNYGFTISTMRKVKSLFFFSFFYAEKYFYADLTAGYLPRVLV